MRELDLEIEVKHFDSMLHEYTLKNSVRADAIAPPLETNMRAS